jgi:phage gpG-like protein
MIDLIIKIEGLQALKTSIDNLHAKLAASIAGDTIKTSIGEILVARARRTIKEAGMGLPGGWAPIKKPTIDSRWTLEQKKKPAKRLNKQGIVSNAPLQRTGAGLQSLNYNLTDGGIELSALRYMGWQQTGTKPYTIYPKNKKALAIPGLGIFKHVNHPGLPARPFFVVLPEDVEDIKTMVIDDIKQML